MKKTQVTAIDIGTTKVCTITGIVDRSSDLQVTGFGITPSAGMEKGLVVNSGEVEESIRQSVKIAEMMSGDKLKSASISLSGGHIRSLNSRGTVAISRKDQIVRVDDLRRAINIALDIKAEMNRRLLEVIPRAYILDGNQVENPIGMRGYELNIEIHLITADVAPVQNLTKCIKDLGIKIERLITAPLASAETVLREEEKLRGVLMADIGGGTTDVAIVKGGAIFHTSILPAAGELVSRDISTGLGLSFEEAEYLKKKYGNLKLPESANSPGIKIGENGHKVYLTDLSQIMRARIEVLVHLILLELQVFEAPRIEYNRLIPAGIVITGGCANLPGILEVVKEISRLPARTGIPRNLGGINSPELADPACATGVGMLLWQLKNSDAQKWVIKAGAI